MAVVDWSVGRIRWGPVPPVRDWVGYDDAITETAEWSVELPSNTSADVIAIAIRSGGPPGGGAWGLAADVDGVSLPVWAGLVEDLGGFFPVGDYAGAIMSGGRTTLHMTVANPVGNTLSWSIAVGPDCVITSAGTDFTYVGGPGGTAADYTFADAVVWAIGGGLTGSGSGTGTTITSNVVTPNEGHIVTAVGELEYNSFGVVWAELT